MNAKENQKDLGWNLSHDTTEVNNVVDEIKHGNFDSFNQLSEEEQIALMETWDKEMWIKYCMQNTLSEEEVFGPLLNDEDD